MSKPNTGTPGAGTGEPPKDTPPQDDPKDKTPAGTPPGDDDAEGDDPPAPPAKTFTQEEVNRMLAKERRDSEKRAKDAEDRAKLGEQERLAKDNEDLRTQLVERDTRDAVKAEASKLGASNPDAVYKLVKDEIERDDKGKIQNLDDVLSEAKDLYPELFGVKKPEGAAPDAGEGGGGGKLYTKEQLEKMTPQQINDNWALVEKSMAALSKK